MASDKAVELRNPLSEDHVALRPNLISGLLDVLERNIRAGAETVSIFEIGRVFIPPSGKEERHLGILLSGNIATASDWRSQIRRSLDLFDLKGALESVVPNVSFRAGKFPDFALAVEAWSGDQRVGFGGQLLAGKSSASNSVLVAELNADLEVMKYLGGPLDREHSDEMAGGAQRSFAGQSRPVRTRWRTRHHPHGEDRDQSAPGSDRRRG